MKVMKCYKQDHVILYVREGSSIQRIMLDDDRQMRRLGECLIDLERTGAKEVEIIPKEG